MSTEHETASEVVDAAPQDAPSAALATYDKVAAGIADLQQRHAGMAYAVTTFKGMEAAKAARLEIREVRFGVQRARDAAKKHLNELKGKIEERAEEIIGQLQPLEDHVDGQIKAEEKRRAEEKEARERAEREARDALMRRLEAIRSIPLDLLNATTAQLMDALAKLQEVDVESFGEFEPAARRALSETDKRLSDMLQVAVAREEAEAARRAEAERLAAERAELERQQAELKRQKDEAEAEQRAQKAAAERQERERQEQLAAERQREADERAAAESERAAAVAKVEAAAGLMLIALVSVRDWNAPRGALPDWIESHVNQALAAAGAPDALPAATATEEAV